MSGSGGNLDIYILDLASQTLTRVTDDRGKRHFTTTGGKLRVANVRGALVVEYGFAVQHDADGLLPGGSTVIWPYFCGNLFPRHSRPADGTSFTLSVDGVPQGETAIYPEAIDAQAPPYMLAFAVGAYGSQALGTTTAGAEDIAVFSAAGTLNQSGGVNNPGELRAGAFGAGYCKQERSDEDKASPWDRFGSADHGLAAASGLSFSSNSGTP